MPAEYQLWLYDRLGSRAAIIERPTAMSYALKSNSVGSLSLTLPRDDIPDELWFEDTRIEVWRRPEGANWAREGQTFWILQDETRGQSLADGRYRRVTAATANSLLGRRIVYGTAGSAEALKTGAASDVMKAYVREALYSGAGNWTVDSVVYTRNWGNSITIAADDGSGLSISKEAGFKNLLTVCQEICRDASYVFFDLVVVPGGLQFRTYYGQRGLNRCGPFGTGGSGQVVASVERGSLGGTVEITTDYEDSATLVVAGGAGQGAARITEYAGDGLRIAGSPWGLREAFTNATSATTSAAVLAEASAELRASAPTKTLRGELLNVPGCQYGVDWNWGDIVLAEFERDTFAAWIDGISVTVNEGVETIRTSLKALAL